MMKRINTIILALLFFAMAFTVNAQTDFYTISGTTKDSQTRRALGHVTILVSGHNVGTISNAEGEFNLKIPSHITSATVVFSHLGYSNTTVNVRGADVLSAEIMMIQTSAMIDELVVQGGDALHIVRAAVERISMNYPTSLNHLTGFYRETVQKRRSYINVSEAVVDLYKTPYTQGMNADRLQIVKGRKLQSQVASDTLAVKLLGGPNVSIFVDIVKNPDVLLDKDALTYFTYTLQSITQVDGRPQYVVAFKPRVVMPFPLFVGTFYIDKESLAFTRAEFEVDMSDQRKVSDMILKKRPNGLRFRPEEVSYIVSYQERDGVNYLNYIRNEIKFRCDWRRRLFSTNYHIVSEMVITDISKNDVVMISLRDSFRQTHVLTDKVLDFYDEDFWGAYNIIEPTESLEQAVSRLKRQQR
jgi:hypothetical protein